MHLDKETMLQAISPSQEKMPELSLMSNVTLRYRTTYYAEFTRMKDARRTQKTKNKITGERGRPESDDDWPARRLTGLFDALVVTYVTNSIVLFFQTLYRWHN
jgi:hypothetical protein